MREQQTVWSLSRPVWPKTYSQYSNGIIQSVLRLNSRVYLSAIVAELSLVSRSYSGLKTVTHPTFQIVY